MKFMSWHVLGGIFPNGIGRHTSMVYRDLLISLPTCLPSLAQADGDFQPPPSLRSHLVVPMLEVDKNDPSEIAIAAASKEETFVTGSRRLTISMSGGGYTALSSLYSSTHGASSWYTKTNWMSGDPCTASW